MEERQNLQKVNAYLQTEEPPELLQAQLETVCYGPCSFEVYEDTNMMDMEVHTHLKSIQDMFVTELICLENIRTNSETFV